MTLALNIRTAFYGQNDVVHFCLYDKTKLTGGVVFIMFSTFYDDEERKRQLRIKKRMEKDEKMVRIDSFNHGAEKLFKLMKKVQARTFSVKCFKYIRNAFFLLGSLLTAAFIDTPIIENEDHVFLLLLNLLVPFIILTFALYFLSLIYFPICKAFYFLMHTNDEIPFKSTGNIAKDTQNMYEGAVRTHKEASSVWSAWWHALYVKRSRILKVITALGCVIVVCLKGRFVTNSNLNIVFDKYNLFTKAMSTESIILSCVCVLGLGLVLYFILWLVFYFSDRMILATQFRVSVTTKCKKFEEKFYVYWRSNDPEEDRKYWEVVNKSSEERERLERSRALHFYESNTTKPSDDEWIPPHIDVSDY